MALSAAERDLLEALVDWAAADLDLSGRPGAQGVINRLPRLNEARLTDYLAAVDAEWDTILAELGINRATDVTAHDAAPGWDSAWDAAVADMKATVGLDWVTVMRHVDEPVRTLARHATFIAATARAAL